MYAQFESMWTQIANRFKDYSERLIFEPFNEIRVHNNWSGGSTHFAVVNELLSRFVKTVRATGGNNTARLLMCPTYAAIVTKDAVEALVLPNDDFLMVSVHDYIPQAFTFKPADWTPSETVFNVAQNTIYYEEIFGRLSNLFTSKGIPVILGEFGAAYKAAYVSNDSERLKWAETVCSVARKHGVICIYWDDGWEDTFDGTGSNTSMGLLNRRTLTWKFPELRDKVINTSLGK